MYYYILYKIKQNLKNKQNNEKANFNYGCHVFYERNELW